MTIIFSLAVYLVTNKSTKSILGKTEYSTKLRCGDNSSTLDNFSTSDNLSPYAFSQGNLGPFQELKASLKINN